MEYAILSAKTYLENSIYLEGYQSVIAHTPNLEDYSSIPTEIFTSILILLLHSKCCSDSSFVNKLQNFVLSWQVDGFFYFYKTQELLPADTDCSALGLSVLYENGCISKDLVIQMAKKILQNTNEFGLIQVYFDEMRPRLDIVVCINALYLLYLVDFEDEPPAKVTLKFIFDSLMEKKYMQSLRYYFCEEQFFFFLYRFIKRFPDKLADFKVLADKIKDETLNRSEDMQNLALSILTHTVSKNRTKEYVDSLIREQTPLGYWQKQAFFKKGRSATFFGCEALTTAIILKALECTQENKEDGQTDDFQLTF